MLEQLSGWQKYENDLRENNYSDEDVALEQQRQMIELQQGGYEQKEIDEYFGIKQPETDPMKKLVESNYQKYIVNGDKDVKNFFDFFDRAVMGKNRNTPNPADNVGLKEAFKEGLQESVPVMQYKARHGDSVIPSEQLPPEYFDSFDRAAKMAGTVAGDLPYMIAGAAGATAITAAAIASAPVTIPTGIAVGAGIFAAGAGANALPAALRSHLMNFYEKGEIKDFSDFWERLTAVVVDTGKEGAIGGTAEVVGGKVGAKIASKGAGYLAQRAGAAGSELATMIGMKSAIEGEVPNLQEFNDTAILLTGMMGSVYVSKKLFNIYKDTGVRPNKVLEQAQKDPALMEEMLTNSEEIPARFEAQITDVQESLDVTKIVEPEVKPDNLVELTDTEKTAQSIQESIGVKEKTITEKAKEFYSDVTNPKIIKDKAKSFYARYVNRFHPISEVSKKAHTEFKLLSGWSGKVETFVDKGVVDFKSGTIVSEGLKDIIAPISKDIKGFETYLVASRIKELRGRGITQKSDLSIEQLNSYIKENSGKFQEYANKFYKWNDGVVQYLVDAGRVSVEEAGKIRDLNKAYIPLKKYVDVDDPEFKKGSRNTLTRKIGSSDLQMRQPLISSIEHTEAMIKIAEKNNAYMSLVNEFYTNQGKIKKGSLGVEIDSPIRKISAPRKPIKITDEEFRAQLREQGLDDTDIDSDVAGFTIFRAEKTELAPNQFEVYRKGKREVYEVLDEDLAGSLASFEGNQLSTHPVMKAMRLATTAFKIGTTGTLEFLTANVFRDQWARMVKTFDYKKLPDSLSHETVTSAFKMNMQAIGALVKKNDLYYQYLTDGGKGSGWADAEAYMANVSENNYSGKEYGEIRSKVRNVVKTAKEYYSLVQLLSEHSTRIMEYRKQLEAGKSRKEAGVAGKNITLDFSQRGYDKTLANYSAVTAFQNVAILGVDDLVKTIGKNPKQVTAASLALLTIPAVTLWLANKDDERYAEIPEWEKHTNLHVITDDWQPATTTGDFAIANSLLGLEKHDNQVKRMEDGRLYINKGVIHRLPIPQGYGAIFATLPVFLLDKFFAENPHDMDEFRKSVFSNMVPSVIPTIATPVIEQAMNQSIFTGGKLIPFTMESSNGGKVLPNLQYTEFTNPSARALGKLIGNMPFLGKTADELNITSPIIIENYVRQWTGQMGVYALELASKATPQSVYQDYDIKENFDKPASTLSDIPIVKKFVSRYPNAKSKSIADFELIYAKYSQLDKSAEIERSRWNFENFSVLKQQQLDSFAPIKGIADAIRNQSALVHITYKRPDLNATEKRQLIESTYFQMIALAQAGLKMSRQFDKDNQQLDEGK